MDQMLTVRIVSPSITKGYKFVMVSYRFICYTVFLATLAICTASCNRNMGGLAEECQSGVVLVQTIEYYEMKMTNGTSLFFTGSDFDKTTGDFIGLTTDLDSLKPDIMYGTGFFVSDDGKIATNRHVVEGNIKEQDARKGLKKIFRALEEALEKSKEHYSMCLSNIKADIIHNPDTIQGLLQAENEAFEFFSKRLDEIDHLLSQLKQNDPNDISLTYHNDIRIAYNNTFIHTTGELKPCTIREKSENDDLAIIQLNTKQTPEGRHVFELYSRDMLRHYSFGEYLMRMTKSDKNDHVMMIGYNEGLSMAKTDEGITAQHQIGSISRNLDEERNVQYDIPALPGSSGSPVINRRGQVVAINFAGADTLSNRFNYGVKAKYLFELIKNL